MDEDDCSELLMVEDAIPINAISFTDAYLWVVDALESYPDKGTEIDEDWLEVLRESRQIERTAGHDPETFDAELEEYWHLRKVANVFLRGALEIKELRACVRDPGTGETLQLPASGWLPEVWIKTRYVPSGIWQDYAIPECAEIPGPRAARIAGKLRPIFLVKSEFDTWLSETFEPDSVSEDAETFKGRRLRDAAKEACLSLFGGPPPAGLPWSRRNAQIGDWLKTNRGTTVADRTISRALEEMRTGRK